MPGSSGIDHSNDQHFQNHQHPFPINTLLATQDPAVQNLILSVQAHILAVLPVRVPV